MAYFGIGMVMTPKVVGAIRVMDPFVSTLVLLALVPAAWCAILIHEAGHLFGGIMVGMKPAFLMVGPLKLVFSGFKASLALNKTLSTWGGLAVCIPRDGRTKPIEMVLMIGAGPAASLLGGLFALGMAGFLEGPYSLVVGFFAILSLAIGFATLLPIRAGGFDSDGGQLLQLATGSKDSVARLLLGVVLGQDGAGVRPREWSVCQINEAIKEVTDPLIRVAAHSILAAHADDAGDTSELESAYETFAKSLHEGGLVSYPTAFRSDLVLPVAIFIAENYHDPDLAEKWILLGDKPVVAPYLLPCAQALVAKSKGKMEEASSLARKAMAMISSSPINGSAMMYVEKLRGF